MPGGVTRALGKEGGRGNGKRREEERGEQHAIYAPMAVCTLT
jgi:hypothetical protein